eukprot:403367437
MKLLVSNPHDQATQLVRVTAKLLNLDIIEVIVPPIPSAEAAKDPKNKQLVADGEKLRAKSLTGKFPVLETPQGHTLMEGLTIAKFLARQRPSFYGDNDLETALIDQWVDYVSSSIAPVSNIIQNHLFGHEESDPKTFSLILNQLKTTLKVFESQLKLKNFLVGYQMTLADVALVSSLVVPLQTVLDAGYRKDTIPNLSRYAQIILDTPTFLQVFGRIHLSKKQLNPKFDFSKLEKKPQQEKQPKQIAAPKKVEQKPTEEVKQPSWEDLLPPTTFDFFNYKTLIVNAADKKEALSTLWSQWENSAFSFWFIHYQKYEGEGKTLATTNNLMNGFMQRMDDKMRKHALGVLGVYGEEPELEIMGVFMWRGVNVIQPMEEHPQFEYYTKRQLNVAESEADRKLVEEFWTKKEEELLEVNGKSQKVQTKKLYK